MDTVTAAEVKATNDVLCKLLTVYGKVLKVEERRAIISCSVVLESLIEDLTQLEKDDPITAGDGMESLTPDE